MREGPLFAKPDIEAVDRGDGSWILRSRTSLEPYEPRLGVWLERWAAERGDTEFLCERDRSGDWRKVTYAQAWDAARSIGQALLARGCGPERPLMVLSGNSVDQGLLMVACYVSGVPIVPVSPAYSLQCTDYTKVEHAVRKTTPGLVYVASVEPFEKVLESVDFAGAEVVSSAPADRTTAMADLVETQPGAAIDRAYAEVGAATVAKILFTSGSTAMPKGVVNTHGMLAANQQQLAQIWPFTVTEPPVLLDWLPWSHTFGGNHNFNLVLRAGGTMYIDAGRPAPGLIEHTIANLRDVSPTAYFNVPAGFAALLPHLEADEELAKHFFARLRLILYAAAALPRDSWDRIDAVARKVTGDRVMMTASWGSTETAPLATSAHFPLEGPGCIGVPVPGVELKLQPNGNKLELLVKGPNVTPGYIGEPDVTRQAFDDEGFYRIGDAGKFVDPQDPAKGIEFDGRVAEDFKLSTGTWVSVTHVRVAALGACSPALQDAVVCGHDGDQVGVMAWLSPAAAQLGGPDEIRSHVRDAVERYNTDNSGSSVRIGRMLILDTPPSVDHNEITDKGYINQRAVLERRAADVERLLAPDPGPEVLAF